MQKYLINKKKYSALYFNKTQKILKNNKNIAIMQFSHFNSEPIYICGIKHVIDLINTLPFFKKRKIEVYGVSEGSYIEKEKPILIIKGPYQYFAHLENLIDGLIARESSVCTNCKKILSLVTSDKIIFMADRADLHINQPYDGYAAYVAGIRQFVTPMQIKLIDDKNNINVVGTIPHSLIQQYRGNLIEVLINYKKTFQNDKLVALVDYTNDVVGEINKIKSFKDLWAIRIDTSSNLVDVSIKKNNSGNKEYNGVCPQLVINARQALDNCDLKKTKIIVSSGFDFYKIKNFIKNNVPADIYGIGGSLLKININITADLVTLNGHHEAKVGRRLYIKINELSQLNKYL